MKDITHIFRSYDIRGVYPEDINEQVAEQVGKAYAQHISGKEIKNVIVAHDVRIGSPQLAVAFIKGASSGDFRIAFSGMLPLGVALFHAHKIGAELAYITASHLPAEWNGIKFFHPTGAGWLEEENFALRDAFLAQVPSKAEPAEETGKILVHEEGKTPSLKEYVPVSRSGTFVPPKSAKIKLDQRHTVVDPDITAANYIRHLMTKIRTSKRLRVILDCGNGAASVVAPKLFALGGFDVKALWAQPDGRFPNRSPDPHSDSLTRLKEAVKSERASLGIAYDGDGDRMVVVDDRGETLTPERTAYFVLSELLKTVQGPIVANVECTRLIDDIANQFGRSIIRVPVGHTYLMDAVHTNKAAFGLEVSGHYALPALVPFDDALAISYYLACILARYDKRLSEVVSEMPSYPFERINFVCDDDQKFAVIDGLKLKLEHSYPSINDMDGLRIDFDDGWVLIRASNTEPKIRLTVEANSQSRFEESKAQFTALLERELHDLYKPSIITKLKKLVKR